MNNLEELREKIDKVDNKILEAISERMELVKKVGEYKKANGIPVLDENRESAVISNKIKQGADKGLSGKFIKDLWRLFINEAYKLEE